MKQKDKMWRGPWVDEWAPMNSWVAELKTVEAKGDAAQAKAWLARVERAVKDLGRGSEKRKAAIEALVVASARGTALLPRSAERALLAACEDEKLCWSIGRCAVVPDVSAAKMAALVLAESHPDLIVSLGKCFQSVEQAFAGKLFAMAMDRPVLRFQGLLAYGSMLDEAGERTRAFLTYKEAFGVLSKNFEEDQEYARGMLVRLAEMYETGEGTETNALLAFSVAKVAASS